jgi:RHH-type transcriptional regulator, proline utilization regulon repressor / proline dehydrogenase / delta 1-pyrroline-5-carboxylate dehydrogenase
MQFDPNILSISRHAFDDEGEVVAALLKEATAYALLNDEIMALATPWVEAIRAQHSGASVETFLQEYGLETEEGVALMCLAEALLRIPDDATAEALIRDKLSGANWRAHLGHSDSFWVNASAYALLASGSVLKTTDGLWGKLKHAASRVGEPVIREAIKAAMRFIGSQFVLGETIESAMKHAEEYTHMGYSISYDMLGEGARTDAQAEAYLHSYLHAIEKISSPHRGEVRRGADLPNYLDLSVNAPSPPLPLWGRESISVKLSALSPHYKLTKFERVMGELKPRLLRILEAAKAANVMVSLDAEESTRLDVELHLFHALLREPSLAGWNGLGFVVQAYNKRACLVVDWLIQQAQETRRNIPVRLVKGAYWDSEIKTAQVQGLPDYPVFTRKEHTDISYLVCAAKLLQCEHLTPQFATHNARTLATVLTLAKHLNVPTSRFEIQRLHGMGEALHNLALTHVNSRIYAPVGAHKDLLAYLIRRLLENGANSSFVHALVDEKIPSDELLRDPVQSLRDSQDCDIPLPRMLYTPHRLNSYGFDFGNAYALRHSGDCVPRSHFAKGESRNPAKKESDPAMQRDDSLSKAAHLLETRRAELMHLLIEEGKKTWADALAEVREAADFCRFYAAETERIMQPQALPSPTGESNVLTLHPRGTFVCISPWNFPLAIFMGQVAAALATGNNVIAKPAEQTPRIAQMAVDILYEAGVPREQLELALGDGKIGAALVARPDIAGVVFTGSTEVARSINQTLAAKSAAIVPLIAETGGQNCMVIDSSALLEHALDDVVISAFGSAGQRCSALRVCFVQEDIADDFMALLSDAMAALEIGDPAALSTDIPPVIDAEAQQTLLAHIEHMKKTARLIGASPLPANLPPMSFVAPHAFEIQSISELTREIFGPVLHVIRFKSSEMQSVADAINATGYGLTFGIASRIDAHIDFFLSRVKAGNSYVNRSMIGATVGVQPFGGEGLSGTGFKAGGPHYLLKFLTERVATINTAAIGGNVTLLTRT